MLIRKSILTLAILSGLFSTGAYAQKTDSYVPQKASKSVDSDIRQNLLKRINGMPAIDEVLTTPMPGIFEVRVGRGLLYTDSQANFIIKGQIIDAQSQVNLTAERIDKLSQVNFSDLPMKDSLKIVKGDGSRKLAIFADPNCGFCKKLEKELEGVKNVTLQIFLTPVLGEQSVAKSNNVWCAADPVKAWSDLMLSNKEPAVADKKCNTQAITRNMELARELGINGTPTIFFEDGTRQAGYMPVDALIKRLDEVKKTPASKVKN